MSEYNYYMIGNLIELDKNCKVDLFEDLCIQKAEIELMERLSNTLPTSHGYNIKFLFEKEKKEIDGERYVYVDLKKEDFRYCIFKTPDLVDKYTQQKLNEVLCLMSPSLRVIDVGEVRSQRAIVTSNLMEIDKYSFVLRKGTFMKPVKLTDKWVEDFRSMYGHYSRLNKTEFTYVTKALKDFSNIYRIHDYELRYLLFFSVIESLLSYPGAKSIEKILVKKLDLIIRKTKFDLSVYTNGSDIKFKELIKKLYTYRSNIAHGSYHDLDSNLQELRTFNAHKLVEELTKCLLRFSIENPEFIEDIKIL